MKLVEEMSLTEKLILVIQKLELVLIALSDICEELKKQPRTTDPNTKQSGSA